MRNSFFKSVLFKILFLIALTLFFTGSSFAAISIQEKNTKGRSALSFSYFGLFNHEMGELEEGGGRLSSYNFITTSYRLGLDSKVAFRLPFSFNSYGFDDFNGDSKSRAGTVFTRCYIELCKL